MSGLIHIVGPMEGKAVRCDERVIKKGGIMDSMSLGFEIGQSGRRYYRVKIEKPSFSNASDALDKLIFLSVTDPSLLGDAVLRFPEASVRFLPPQHCQVDA
uniref:Uncharacterized protein n=1 Tax=Lactuca sativa TaxID=4236 RepID=A0A9R1VZU4_LACSA|nr:hypothetical protein LSAT_V11C300116650 [Lactuca sativa]